MSTLKVNSIKSRNTGSIVFPDDVEFQGAVTVNNLSGYARQITADDNALLIDGTVYVDASGGAVTYTLPALSSAPLGWRVTVRASDVSNDITISPQAGDSIVSLTAGTGITLSSVGDYWTLEAGPSRWELVAGYETKNTGTNYCLANFYPNGVLVQRGYITWSSDTWVSINLVTPFLNTDVAINANLTTGSVTQLGVYAQTTSTSTIRLYHSDGAASADAWWTATGRWYA